MKNIEVQNSKLSKKGISTNFSFNGRWYSIKNITIKNKGIDIEGKVIEIVEYKTSGSWIMIKDFVISGEITKRKIKETPSSYTSYHSYKMNNNLEKSTTKIKLEEFIDNKMTEFSPIELTGSIFSSSTRDLSFKVDYISGLKDIHKKYNPYASVMQNIINRGNKIFTNNDKVDSLLFTIILELFKRGYKTKDFKITLDYESFSFVSDTKKELIEYIRWFSKITNAFPKGMIEFIDGLKISKSIKVEYIAVISKKEDMIIELKKVTKNQHHLPPSFISIDRIKYKSLIKNKVTINKILKLVFYNDKTKISKLKEEQLLSLDFILNRGKNILAVLKTGFGKSLIYQFASILQPVIFLNIFPINSLIKDQSISISDEMNLTYSIDNEELKTINNSSLHRKLLATKRMFLVTPERLENKEMQNYFWSLNEMIGFMIFDEAHCISEWGHDFRPSYLMARHLMESLTKNNDLKVIALTATAAPHIQKDIAKLLQIDKGNIINIANSSGLERKEIKYEFIKHEINDFDRWNRSKAYTSIIDEYINYSKNNYEQGIAFFMKSGNFSDEEKDKYLIKINAFSAFKRLSNKSGVGLYSGKNKFIENMEHQIPPSQFSKFRELNYILATKSFGMGINLKKCDYVLLSEPPYSLEDLYQQSGRVGRVGQESLVQILYHNRSLIDPLSKDSPYSFFLIVEKKRREQQLIILSRLIELIFKEKSDFTLNLRHFLNKNTVDEQNYLKWAISHLITEFNLIEKYHVKYGGGMFKLASIGIFINKNIDPTIFLNKINESNKKIGILKHSSTINDAISMFYDYYFDKLQNDKLIGINILRNKLLDSKEELGNKAIYEVLTDYYRTRMDDVDKMVVTGMQKIIESKSIEEIIEAFSKNSNKINKFELMEAVSRFPSTKDYIEIGSLIINFLYDENMLVTNRESIIRKAYKNKNLEDIKNMLLYKIYFTKFDDTDEYKNERTILLKNKEWKKIDELTNRKKILEGLNG